MPDYLHVITRRTDSASPPAMAAADVLGEPPPEELSDDQLEHVVGGLARAWVGDATRALMLRHYNATPSSPELML